MAKMVDPDQRGRRAENRRGKPRHCMVDGAVTMPVPVEALVHHHEYALHHEAEEENQGAQAEPVLDMGSDCEATRPGRNLRSQYSEVHSIPAPLIQWCLPSSVIIVGRGR